MTTYQDPIDQQSPAIYAGHEISRIQVSLVAEPSTGDLTHSGQRHTLHDKHFRANAAGTELLP